MGWVIVVVVSSIVIDVLNVGCNIVCLVNLLFGGKCNVIMVKYML